MTQPARSRLELDFIDTHSRLQIARLLFAGGIGALGALTLASSDFAFQWQPVPASVPARAALAQIVGIIFIAIAALLLAPRTLRLGAGILASAFWLWQLLLHVPPLISTGENWLGAAELLALCGGSLAFLGMVSDGDRGRHAAVIGKYLFALSLPIFGWSHFFYAVPASQLIPDWIPGRLFFTYLTGTAHILAGLSLLTGLLARIAAPWICIMFASFIAFLHIPHVIVAPSSRYEWTALLMSTLLSGAAWSIAAVVRREESRTAMREERGLVRADARG